MKRLVPKEQIPLSLWSQADSILHLPPNLIVCWESLIDKYELREKALERAPDGFEGGRSKEDTDNHLAWRFTGSSARVMLPMLDPTNDLGEIPDAFAKTFSGNKVFLADLPCGSGAASLTILSVLYELRKTSVLPRMPLEIVIVGGEISKHAQEYAKEALTSLISELETQAINLSFEILDWDVCDPFSNSDLVKHLTLVSQDCSAKLMVLANFSGFLQRDGKWKEAQKQFEELFRHGREENSIALWIEPQRNDVVIDGGFMPRLISWFKRAFSAFISFEIEGEEYRTYAKSSVKVKHPLKDNVFRTNLVVVRFDLPLRRKP